jgi:hypothetical protein
MGVRKTCLFSQGLRVVLMTGILAWMLPAGSQAQSLGLYPTAAPSADADRLSDAEELTLGTNPSLADMDGDFITDSDELLITGTNPLLADSDMDGLTDYEEWVVLIPRLWDVDKNGMLDIDPLGVHPPLTQDDESPFGDGDIWWITAHLTDYDGDGLWDRDEIIFGNFSRYDYNRAYVDWPNGEGETYDTESWGQLDHWEPTDYDRDGLNAAEEALLQTDPNDPDTDGDGLQDGLDSIFADPLLVDTNSDGVSDHDELMYYAYAGPYFGTEEDLAVAIQTALGSSALGFILDWDGDGMSNVWEIAHGLNPVNILDAYDDPDGDFLCNIEEYQARSDPHALLSTVAQSVTLLALNPVTQQLELRAAVNDYEAVMGVPVPAGMVRDNGPLSIHDYDDDWDGDGYGNRDEMLAVPVRNPRFNELQDTDSDGLTDIWETLKGLDKNDADEDADSLSDGADDFDNDGLTNLGEQSANTNPLLADTDGDSLPDGWEVAKGLNALNADQDGDNLTDDADNFDIDLLTNAQELAVGTHPRYADTDWDGLRDDWELANQLNPLSSVGIHGGSGDADGDGFSNAAEQTAGSSPQSAGSTPPATFIFKSWAAEGEGEGDTPGNYEGFVRSLAGPEQEQDFPYTPNNQPIPKANEAALWTETTIKALDYAGASVTPWTLYNPAQSLGGDVRWVGPAPWPIPYFVAVKADFEWLGYDFRSDYRRVRLEAQQAVGAAETRTYLVFTETEVTDSQQVVGKVEFTLPAGETKASVTVDSALNQYGLSVAADGKTLCIEPPPPTLTVHGFFKRSVYLLPVDVRDGIRVLTSLSLNEDPWTTANLQKQVADSSIAWITGNTGFAGTPEMPKLNARISNGPPSMNVRWRFECEYKRGNGYRQPYVADFTRPEDKVGIPYQHDGGYTEYIPASEEWKINEHSKWVQELNENGFFGGLAKVFIKLDNQPEMEVFRFRIGGKNPDESSAKSYINSQAGATYWYAYAIAKHETFGRVPGRFYNHFYTEHQQGPIGDNSVDMGLAAWAKSWPLYNLDRGRKKVNGEWVRYQNGPGGYGMFQLTLGPKTPNGDQSSEGFITRAQIWNWQENTNRAIEELAGKLTKAQTLKNGLETGFTDWGPLPNYKRFDPLGAIVATYYNGMYKGDGGDLQFVKVNGRNTLSCWSPEKSGSQRRWQFRQNDNHYVEKVEHRLE